MAELERTKTIILTIPLEDTAQKIRYEQLELKAPTLTQVEKFYEKQESSTSIAAMRLLIALVTDTRESVLAPMDYVDFCKCKEYLLGFFELEALTAWQEVAADVTFYFGWSDERAWGMTQKRLLWWGRRPNELIN
ncbi:Uncharacterised protein [Raoultella ornithinolytica]|nr:Uncharacterised protein [Raoultella ornithinolytica]